MTDGAPDGKAPAAPRPAGSIRPDAVPARSAGMAWQIVEGETLLLNVAGRELMGLNEVGAVIWSLIDGTRTVAQIAEAVTERFEVAAEVAQADVTAFVSDLARAGALYWKA